MNVTKGDIQIWLFSAKGIQAEVKRLNSLCFWVRSLKQEDFSQTVQMGTSLNEGPLGRLDRWTEVIGLELKTCWVRLVGIPLHAWDGLVFKCLGDCLGVVMEIEEKAVKKKED